jgi:hypothetical protein
MQHRAGPPVFTSGPFHVQLWCVVHPSNPLLPKAAHWHMIINAGGHSTEGVGVDARNGVVTW